MTNLLKINNLSKKYLSNLGEVPAIKDISFDLNEKDFIAIVGPSGCGKSTLLSILANLENKTNGEIIYNNDNIKIGYMFQQDCLFDHLTILDNCLLGLRIQGKVTKQNKEYVLNLLESYGLTEFINKYPKNLSGGMRQRAALIRSLAIKPDIILLDEPFSALDAQTRLVVSDDVYKIIKKENKTAIMVTHNISEAVTMASKVIVLSERPATIKKIFDIKLTNATTPINNRKCKEFDYYYDNIWKELDFNV